MTETKGKADDGAGVPRKPSLARQAAPVLLALAILGYMFYSIDFGKVLEALSGAKVSWIVAAYLTYCAVYYGTDVLSFFRTYQRLEVPIGVAETARLRFASYAVQAINGAITELMTVLYLYRVKKTPVLRSTGAAGFIYYCETLSIVALLGYCAFWLPAEYRIDLAVPWINLPFWSVFQALIVIVWALVPPWLIFWRTGLKDRFPRVRDAGVLAAFQDARLLDYVEVFLYRFATNFVSLLANVVMLRAMDVEAPLALMFAAVPIMVNVAYWPVSVGGFGGPQLVAQFLFKGHAREEEILAYSLVWSALFFITRWSTGVAFLRPVYRAAFASGEEVEEG